MWDGCVLDGNGDTRSQALASSLSYKGLMLLFMPI